MNGRRNQLSLRSGHRLSRGDDRAPCRSSPARGPGGHARTDPEDQSEHHDRRRHRDHRPVRLGGQGPDRHRGAAGHRRLSPARSSTTTSARHSAGRRPPRTRSSGGSAADEPGERLEHHDDHDDDGHGQADGEDAEADLPRFSVLTMSPRPRAVRGAAAQLEAASLARPAARARMPPRTDRCSAPFAGRRWLQSRESDPPVPRQRRWGSRLARTGILAVAKTGRESRRVSRRPRGRGRARRRAARAWRADRPATCSAGSSACARARADQLGVDEAVAEVDVGEQPAVDVAPLGVEDEPHRPPVDEPWLKSDACGPEALDRRAGLDRLRRVDADVADVLASPPSSATSIVSPSTTRTTCARPAPAGRLPRRRPPSPRPPSSAGAAGEQQRRAAPAAPAAPASRPLPSRSQAAAAPPPALESAATGCGGRWRAASP